jgi:hypothetical protein
LIWAELAKAVAWPIAAIVIAVIFRPGLIAALSSFAQRKVKFKGPGFEAEVDSPEKQLAPVENPVNEKLPDPPALDSNPRPAVGINRKRSA